VYWLCIGWTEDRETVLERDHTQWTSTLGEGWAKVDMVEEKLKLPEFRRRYLWVARSGTADYRRIYISRVGAPPGLRLGAKSSPASTCVDPRIRYAAAARLGWRARSGSVTSAAARSAILFCRRRGIGIN